MSGLLKMLDDAPFPGGASDNTSKFAPAALKRVSLMHKDVDSLQKAMERGPGDEEREILLEEMRDIVERSNAMVIVYLLVAAVADPKELDETRYRYSLYQLLHKRASDIYDSYKQKKAGLVRQATKQRIAGLSRKEIKQRKARLARRAAKQKGSPPALAWIDNPAYAHEEDSWKCEWDFNEDKSKGHNEFELPAQEPTENDGLDESDWNLNMKYYEWDQYDWDFNKEQNGGEVRDGDGDVVMQGS
ncbi:hypothetical protein F4677DRAFT_442085 [Hypoxylon crocopeplum]|nr:hypothetical protein F4677DRAFT_442085 [Hypoxylon crocopeplum]